MAGPIIKFVKVVKRFGVLTVLDELDFKVHRGEKASIFGPSGSGKSKVRPILMTLEGIESARSAWSAGSPPRRSPLHLQHRFCRFRYGFRYCAGSSRTSWPRAVSSLAQ